MYRITGRLYTLEARWGQILVLDPISLQYGTIAMGTNADEWLMNMAFSPVDNKMYAGMNTSSLAAPGSARFQITMTSY
jgi:hypothetical protein